MKLVTWSKMNALYLIEPYNPVRKHLQHTQHRVAEGGASEGSRAQCFVFSLSVFVFLRCSAHLIRNGIFHVNTCGFEWVRVGCISLMMRHKKNPHSFHRRWAKRGAAYCYEKQKHSSCFCRLYLWPFQSDSNPHNRSAIYLLQNIHTHISNGTKPLSWGFFFSFFFFFQTEAWSLMRNNWSDLRYAFKSTFQVMG